MADAPNIPEYSPPVSDETIQSEISRMAQKVDNDTPGDGFSSQGAKDFVSNIMLQSGMATQETRVSAAFLGLNLLGTPTGLLQNTDHYGLVFFTRPSLNLSYDNCILDRTFVPMLTENKKSSLRAIRAYLDPDGSRYNYPSDLVDPKQAFIPILTNLCETLSGWPDPQVDTYESHAGLYREKWAMYDGTIKIYGTYTLNASFKNTANDPISGMFNTWTAYGAYVYDGTMDPSINAIVQRYIDYQTRIYRVVLDSTRTRVQKIACCGVAIPTSNNLGSSFDYDVSKPVNAQLDQINVTFLATGAEYNDPRTIYEFNKVVAIFNRDMNDTRRDKKMRLLKTHEKQPFNFAAYPRIDPVTMEFQWWVEAAIYQQILGDID